MERSGFVDPGSLTFLGYRESERVYSSLASIKQFLMFGPQNVEPKPNLNIEPDAVVQTILGFRFLRSFVNSYDELVKELAEYVKTGPHIVEQVARRIADDVYAHSAIIKFSPAMKKNPFMPIEDALEQDIRDYILE